ncbi:MAG TPA: hypothetical protein VGB63_16720 [Pedobacter sp.]|jgi:hypothetical protein
MKRLILFFLFTAVAFYSQAQEKVFPGADESSPSRSMYFDWINRNWHGSNENKVLSGLNFFKWLHNDYGMKLDIFLMDAGVIDNGPNCLAVDGRPAYGSFTSPWFKERFPNKFDKIYQSAKSFNCRLGLWIGPDGYGDTEEEARQRINLITGLTKDYNMALFKMDACCSNLRPEKEKYFIETWKEARKYSPDLILLNHRITLSDEARKHATTFLWEGKETYIDVNASNTLPAIHHRQGTMDRGLPPGLQRLTEDHGVCISSGNDNWDDDLVLQAFNRSLILAPEVYGNPWLLSDKEFPKLARIYNFHKRNSKLLIKGIELDESKYGYKAVSRGDDNSRIITLRNLSWNPVKYKIRLDESIGLKTNGKVQLNQFHPTERFLGLYASGTEVEVNVDPFRAAMFTITADTKKELTVEGVDYQVIKDVPGKPVEIRLLGMPGKSSLITVTGADKKIKSARLDGTPVSNIIGGYKIKFSGTPLTKPTHRKLGELQPASVPSNARSLYETAYFGLDNNALEVRSLERAGPTKFPAVKAARDAFFKDSIFIQLGLWDKFAFDNNDNTSFKANKVIYTKDNKYLGALRLDVSRVQTIDKIVLESVPDTFKVCPAYVSADLTNWQRVELSKMDNKVSINTGGKSFRYLLLEKAPLSITEIQGYKDQNKVKTTNWRVSNLFKNFTDSSATFAKKQRFRLDEIARNSYLSVTVPGTYGEDNTTAVMRAGGKIIGPADRSPSFAYNNWEHYGVHNGNYTFYFPISEAMKNKDFEVILLGNKANLQIGKPEVWITSKMPFEEKILVLE